MFKYVQMNWFIIWTKYINNWINYLWSITSFLRQMINYFLATDYGNLLKWLLEYEYFISDLWTGTWIGVGFWTLITSYACICVMSNRFGPYFWSKWSWRTIFRSHNINITNLYFSPLKYESVPHHETMNPLESLYIIFPELENSNQFPLSSSVT